MVGARSAAQPRLGHSSYDGWTSCRIRKCRVGRCRPRVLDRHQDTPRMATSRCRHDRGPPGRSTCEGGGVRVAPRGLRARPDAVLLRCLRLPLHSRRTDPPVLARVTTAVDCPLSSIVPPCPFGVAPHLRTSCSACCELTTRDCPIQVRSAVRARVTPWLSG